MSQPSFINSNEKTGLDQKVDQGSTSELQNRCTGFWPFSGERSFLQSPLSQPSQVGSEDNHDGVLDGEHSHPSNASMIPDNNQNTAGGVNSRFKEATETSDTMNGSHTYQPTLRGDLLATRPTFSQIFLMSHISPSTNHEAHRPSTVSQASSRNFSNSPCSPIIYARRRVSDDFPRVMRRTVRGRKYPVQIPVTSDKSLVIDNHKTCILLLARALATFGAPLRSIESRLDTLARRLDLPATFIRVPSAIICVFADQDNKSESHFIKRSGQVSLRNLRKVDLVYRKLVLDHVTDVERASKEIEEVLLLAHESHACDRHGFNRVIRSSLLIPYLIRGAPTRRG